MVNIQLTWIVTFKFELLESNTILQRGYIGEAIADLIYDHKTYFDSSTLSAWSESMENSFGVRIVVDNRCEMVETMVEVLVMKLKTSKLKFFPEIPFSTLKLKMQNTHTYLHKHALAHPTAPKWIGITEAKTPKGIFNSPIWTNGSFRFSKPKPMIV